MAINYRNIARKHLKFAQNELGEKLDQRLKYAALELRMAMEALTYDRALAYKDEFPPNEYETWQPRKVMFVLLEIDPMADKDSSVAYSEETKCGASESKKISLGSEKVLNMKVLKKHYDALGSYLHIQSMKQAQAGAVLDFDKLRVRLEEIANYVNGVLSSPIFNITLGNFARLDCMECGTPIRKRIPSDMQEFSAECYSCKATYTIRNNRNGEVDWELHQHEIECANPNCHKKIVVLRHELEVGRQWECPSCNGKNTLVLAVNHEKTPNI